MGAPRSFTILRIVDASMLMGATSLAFLFACRRKIALHRQWATRSYAIALVFIGGRFVGITGWEALGVEIVQAMIGRVWRCPSCLPTSRSTGKEIQLPLYRHVRRRM
jgi:hypothetical protein